MVKMKKDKKTYDIAEERVEKLLKRGFKLVTVKKEKEEKLSQDD